MAPRKLGRLIRALRESKGLTQSQLAERAELTQGYLAKLENGMKANPSLAALKRLAKALKVPPGELIE